MNFIDTDNLRDLLTQCENVMEKCMVDYNDHQSTDSVRLFNSIILGLSRAQYAIKKGLEGDFD